MRIVSIFTALAAFSFCAASNLKAQTVVINELMAAGQNVIDDEDGEKPDWIELRNTGAAAVNLKNWALTDDAAVPQKWKISAGSIAPGGYLVVFASGKDRKGGDPLHTNFNLGSGGEYLALVKPNGTVASEFTFPAQMQNISYGVSGAERKFFQTATPGEENGAAFVDVAIAPQFNRRHGFQNAAFNLVMATTTPGSTVRYTLDGTAPTESHGEMYAGPILINKTTVVRAATAKTDYVTSPVTTASYIFTADVIRQSPDGETPAGGWPSLPQEKFGLNYGMDPDVVNSPLYRDSIQNDLKSIPTLSLVCDLKDLYDNDTGIFANPYESGIDWERPMSLELIEPDGSAGFTQPGGMRVRGGASRDQNNPKHSFRIFFRGKYGDDDLDAKFFGEDGASSFDKFDIRNDQIVSWHLAHDATTRFIQDQFLRDTVRLAGFPSTRGDFYHVYINGQYWGMSNTEERPEGTYAATYFGGKPEDYDVLNKGEPTQGDIEGWNRAIAFAKRGLGTNAAYQKLQGLNPDGTRNPQFEPLVDVDSLIMYMMVGSWLGVHDTPADHGTQNNWYQIKSRTGKFGMRFISHDTEISMLDVGAVFIDPSASSNPFDGLEGGSVTPWHMWEALRSNAEFRLRVADYAHRFFFNDGLMTPTNADRRWRALMSRIDRAVVGESARWGDFSVWNFGGSVDLFTRSTWLDACDNILNTFLPQRSDNIMSQLRAAGLYPPTEAPEFSQFGGTFAPGATLTLTNPGGTGTLFYTTDGSDPRKIGGAVSGKARAFTVPIPLASRTIVSARVKIGKEWSALAKAEFIPAQDVSGLRFSEIHYNPPAVGAVSGDEYEFIELTNTSTVPIDLSGFRFLSGVTFEFPAATRLQPGAFFVLARNAARFTEAHPGRTPNGIFEGKLDNGGEELAITAANGAVVLKVTYDDDVPWPITADGLGFSIVYRDGDPHEGTSWTASAQPGGSPGVAEPAVVRPAILVNEVRSRSATDQPDAIELFNASAGVVDISGWWLSDNASVPKKFRIPAGTAISAGGFVVFNEPQFNPTPGVGGNSFGIDATGDSTWLFAANAAGDLTGYFHGFKFAASDADVSFGRHVTSEGLERFVAQSSSTFGAANAGPVTPQIQITEIHYQPTLYEDVKDEFIELRNTTSATIQLEGWRISGLDFTFPVGTSLGAGAYGIVSALDAAEFRTKYNIPPTIQVFGAALGILQNSGERVEVRKPGPLDTNGVPSAITVDSVRYNDRAPWPLSAAGAGPSLQLLPTATFGDDPASWFASGPTPGGASVFNAAPTVTLVTPVNGASFTQPRAITLTATADDSDGSIAKVQFFDGEQLIGEATSAPFTVVWDTASSGNHDIVARAVDDRGAVTDTNPNVILVRPPGASIGIGLLGEYFPNADFSGTPITRVDPRIEFDLGSTPIDGITAAPYSIRWTGFIRAPKAGEYTFTVESTSGITLTVGSEEPATLDETGDLGKASTSLLLRGGQLVPVTIELVETDGSAQVYFSWSGPGIDDGIVPETNLYGPEQDPDGLGIVTGARLPTARRKEAYSAQLTAINGVAPYAWTATDLPKGLAISADGMISGRPTVTNDYDFQASVKDAENVVVTKSFSLRVRAAIDDGPRPKLIVQSPQNNQRIGRGLLEFRGTATHKNGIESVEYSVNGEEWQTANLVENAGWLFELEAENRLRPGNNTISIRANEPVGSQSPTITRTMNLVLTRVVRVSVSGPGSISGALLGENIVRNGTVLTLTAKPAPGNIFNAWFGTDEGQTLTPTITVVVNNDMDLSAQFSRIPRNNHPGTFAGLIGEQSGEPLERGKVTLTLAKDSFFTGVLQKGTVRTPLKGRFSSEGAYFGPLGPQPGKGGATLIMNFDPGDENAITGQISDGGIIIDIGPRRLALGGPDILPPDDGGIIFPPPRPIPNFFTLRRPNFTANSPCPLAGQLTIQLRSNGLDGHGFAAATVSPGGKARITGVLGNGTKWKTSATVDSALELPIYLPVHKKLGSLSGIIRFVDDSGYTGTSDMLWHRPIDTAGPNFPNESVTTVPAVASVYLPPKGTELALPSLNYGALFNAADFETPVSGSAVISAGNVWTFGGTGLDPAPTLRIDPKTGIVTGSILRPGTTVPVIIQGIIDQRERSVFGYFPTTNSSGKLEILPFLR